MKNWTLHPPKLPPLSISLLLIIICVIPVTLYSGVPEVALQIHFCDWWGKYAILQVMYTVSFQLQKISLTLKMDPEHRVKLCGNPCFGEPTWPLIHLQLRLLFKWIGAGWAVSQVGLLEGNQHTLSFSFSSSLAVKIIHHNQERGTGDGRSCGSICILCVVQPGYTPSQRVVWAWASRGIWCISGSLCRSVGHKPLC